MADERMNYDAMRQMAAEFKNTATQMTQAISAMQNIAKALDGGALLGQGGATLSTAITGKLLPRMKQLHSKMTELNRDVVKAVQANTDAVGAAQRRFQ